MRLGLSMVVVAALSAGLVACSSSTGDGAGGAGGSGSGGDDTTSQGGSDTTSQGGSDTTSQGGAGGGGEGGGDSDGQCVVENVEVVDGEAFCDVDCTTAFVGSNGDVAMCTATCDPAGDGTDCGPLTCFEASDGTGVCLHDCADGAACPGTAEYVCDQDAFFCDPDGVSE